MRKCINLLAFVSLAMPALAAKRVDIRQLDQELAEVKTKPDAEVAHRLAGLELTERMSAVELMRWRDAMRPRVETCVGDTGGFLCFSSYTCWRGSTNGSIG